MPVECIASYSSSQLDAISGMHFFFWPGESVLFNSESGYWHVNLKSKEIKWKPSTSCKIQKNSVRDTYSIVQLQYFCSILEIQ